MSESDSGGQLTLDHFRPRAKAGADHLDNLIYCCARCNGYKRDYWPSQVDQPALWNPRQEPAGSHLLQLDDGTLHPLTMTGAFTIRRLRLNRLPLVAHRLQKGDEAEARHLLTRYRQRTALLEQLHHQQTALLEEQRALLAQYRAVLGLLLNDESEP